MTARDKRGYLYTADLGVYQGWRVIQGGMGGCIRYTTKLYSYLSMRPHHPRHPVCRNRECTHLATDCIDRSQESVTNKLYDVPIG